MCRCRALARQTRTYSKCRMHGALQLCLRHRQPLPTKRPCKLDANLPISRSVPTALTTTLPPYAPQTRRQHRPS
eukprot:1323513-Pleurochrysis_carterae.AAC.1